MNVALATFCTFYYNFFRGDILTHLFDSINTRNQEKLLKMLETYSLHFSKNTSIFSTFSSENVIGYIAHGFLQVIKMDKNGTKTIIEEIYENDILNTVFFSIDKNDYDVIAKEETELLFIDYESILTLKDTNKDFYIQFIKNLLKITNEKTKEKNERIEILIQYFTIMSNKHSSKFIYLPFNFIDLADYLAVDRCAMSRELKYLKEEGFIEIKGKRITLLYDKYSSSDKLINL